MFHLIPYLHKKPDNIIVYIWTNDRPYSNENTIYEEMKKIKELMKTLHPDCKNTFISSLILCSGNKKAVNVLKNYIKTLKEEQNVTLHDKIKKSHLHRYGLHLNLKGTIALDGNFISRIRKF